MTDAKQALQVMDQPPMPLDAVGRKAAIDELVNKIALVQEVMKTVMHEGEHFGVIPGCGTKPALLKAGAEKLGMTFRFRPSFEINERDLGRAHREYSIVCTLSDGTQGVGSCSTMETKYRYRQGERKCPECGKATIITGKKEWGGGFLCFQKKGGCGAKFADNDERILEQQVGKVEHDNPADFYNTCLKMGKKRAHVDAIITATACSDIFTQDVDEIVQDAAPPPTAPASEPKKETPKPKATTTEAEQVIPLCTVSLVTQRDGTKANGQPWHAFFCKLNDGIGELEAGTFSATTGALAIELQNTGENAKAVIKAGKKAGTFELVSLARIEPSDDDVPS